VNRKDFLQLIALLPFASSAMNINSLQQYASQLPNTPVMPVLFLGHGSPMNAIEKNEFSMGWINIVKNIPKPAAILCVSAHWETKGTFVTAAEMPATIHDFGGFPKELFAVQYPAPGSITLANATKEMVTAIEVGLDQKWGLDHGSWSLLKHLYPKADVPVVQLSLDYTKPPQYHYDLAKQLSALRRKGILIIGSGNMVHNLRMLNWQQPETGFDWAVEVNEKLKGFIANANHSAIINYKNLGKAFELAVPTPEHFLPLLYTLALQEKNETASVFNDKAVMGSITMTSVKIA
jgi:4,5-DOPA dioxygenase extradiol